MQQRQLFICSRAPASELAPEACDAVLMAAMLDQRVSLLFIGDGVAQLSAGPEHPLTQKLHSLHGFGVETAYLGRIEAEQHSIDPSRCPLPLTLLDRADIGALLNRQDRIYSF